MLLKVENLEFKFKNTFVLKSLCFSVEKGKNLLILGPSGSGKTTLLNILAGLLKPFSGNIFFENQNLYQQNDIQIDKIRKQNFGFIFQNLNLIRYLNVEQNILLANNYAIKSEVENLISNLGIFSQKNKLVSNISLGERQRTAIARAVINKPKIIFADEPTSALDDENTEKVMDVLFERTRELKSSLIVCTHDSRIKKMFKDILEL